MIQTLIGGVALLGLLIMAGLFTTWMRKQSNIKVERDTFFEINKIYEKSQKRNKTIDISVAAKRKSQRKWLRNYLQTRKDRKASKPVS